MSKENPSVDDKKRWQIDYDCNMIWKETISSSVSNDDLQELFQYIKPSYEILPNSFETSIGKYRKVIIKQKSDWTTSPEMDETLKNDFNSDTEEYNIVFLSIQNDTRENGKKGLEKIITSNLINHTNSVKLRCQGSLYEKDLKNKIILARYSYQNEENITKSLFIAFPEEVIGDGMKSYRVKCSTLQKARIYGLYADQTSELKEVVFSAENISKYFANRDILHQISIKKEIDDNKEETTMKTEVKGLDKAPNNCNPEQVIFYGVPGSGKSYSISEKLKQASLPITEANVKRVVFHPDYSNSDFVGQIMPRMTAKGIEYTFTPGPFTQILRKAYQHPETNYALIIEEINRGNAAAIFGELFQLLDRLDHDDAEKYNNVTYTKGWSNYGIDNDFINSYLLGNYDNESTIDKTEVCINFNKNTAIRLPANLSLFATMNTSDQNIFTLDNAFQRRWEMEMISNDFRDDEKDQAEAIIEFTDFEWKAFVETVNEIIQKTAIEEDLSSMEDKQLGKWFAKNTNGIIEKNIFANKVIKYLWDDALKYNREKLFANENPMFDTLPKIIKHILVADNFEDIFKTEIVDNIKKKNKGNKETINTEARKKLKNYISLIANQEDKIITFKVNDNEIQAEAVASGEVKYINNTKNEKLSLKGKDIMEGEILSASSLLYAIDGSDTKVAKYYTYYKGKQLDTIIEEGKLPE